MSEPEVYGDGCECWVTPREMHYVYYGITEPGSAIEYNPDCPKHGEVPSATYAIQRHWESAGGG